MPSSTRSTHVTRRTRGPRLGDMLVERGLVTAAQLEAALVEQERTSDRLGSILVAQGALKDVDLVRVLAEHFGLEFVDLEERQPDFTVAQRVKESFARYHQLLPIAEKDDAVLVAMVNPTDVFSLDDVRGVMGKEIHPLMAEPNQLRRAIDRVWNAGDTDESLLQLEQDHVDEEPEIVVEVAADAPVVNFVNQLVARAVNERASDIHFEPGEREMRVRFRIDGVLHEVMHLPRSAQLSVVSRLKIMAEINIAERRIPQDGRLSITAGGRKMSLRAVTLPTAYGESVVVRLLEEGSGVRDLAELGMRDEALRVFERSFRKPWGSIIVTGPTGSGKSTTMYATLMELNQPTRNIITVEDPIEYRLAGVKQLQVNRKAGLTFASALRSILRADPDVVMVGEVRDVETARIAVEAALTGHLVLTSLHTNDAASTPARLLDMGVEAFMVTSSINCIVAQRLARRLCEKCKQPFELFDEDLVEGERHPAIPPEAQFYRAVGCNRCSGTGYRGRIALQEVMEMTDEIAHLVASNAGPRDIATAAAERGMVTMREDGLSKAAAGETSLEEVMRCIG